MHERSQTVTCADGYPLAARILEAQTAKATVVIAPALGVPLRFYSESLDGMMVLVAGSAPRLRRPTPCWRITPQRA